VAFAWGCGKAEETPPAAAPPPPAPFRTPTGVEMVLIPAGEFLMGSESGEDDERPRHTVRVSAFSMDRFEVTQSDYEGLMGRNPSKFVGPDRPVERVSWLAAVKYCNMRSLKEGLQPCYDAQTFQCDFRANGYRLPTEAEWEYACRAGTTGDYAFGNDAGRLQDNGWFKADSNEQTHPVGQKLPNPWGFRDMHGNVAEWCNDCYDAGYYAQSPLQDPAGPASGEERVLRGGSWRSPPEACRSSARYSEAPGLADVCFGYEAYGFRCVRRGP